MKLQGKSLFITGGSRGIGRAIALKCAKEGANIAIAAKTDTPHPALKGTIYSVAEEIEALGVRALPIKLDVRDEDGVQEAIDATATEFGGLDILVNNASAISLTSTADTPMKRFDLMMSVNLRATYACSQAALPYLKDSSNPHILTLSPPLSMQAKWFKNHVAYTISKYGMSMCTLGMAEEFKAIGIAVNSLWPKTTIATAAIEHNFPDAVMQGSRTSEIMADSALWIFQQPSKNYTGQFLIDELVLKEAGILNFDKYALNPETPLFSDLFIDER